MPIYRTVSDRGLWKKYHKAEQAGQPQHFHKPQYLDRNKPVVSIKLPNESDKNDVVIAVFRIFNIILQYGLNQNLRNYHS